MPKRSKIYNYFLLKRIDGTQRIFQNQVKKSGQRPKRFVVGQEALSHSQARAGERYCREEASRGGKPQAQAHPRGANCGGISGSADSKVWSNFQLGRSFVLIV